MAKRHPGLRMFVWFFAIVIAVVVVVGLIGSAIDPSKTSNPTTTSTLAGPARWQISNVTAFDVSNVAGISFDVTNVGGIKATPVCTIRVYLSPKDKGVKVSTLSAVIPGGIDIADTYPVTMTGPAADVTRDDVRITCVTS